jgi:hypothetical protein
MHLRLTADLACVNQFAAGRAAVAGETWVRAMPGRTRYLDRLSATAVDGLAEDAGDGDEANGQMRLNG